MTDTYAGNPANYPTLITLIDDTSVPNASNVNPSPQGLADRTAYLRAGHAFPGQNWGHQWAASSLPPQVLITGTDVDLVGVQHAGFTSVTPPYSGSWSTTTFTSSSWTALTSASNLLTDETAYLAGDICEVEFQSSAAAIYAFGNYVPIAIGFCAPGGSLAVAGESIVQIPAASSSAPEVPLRLRAYLSPGAMAGGIQLGLMGFGNGNAVEYALQGSWSITVKHFRTSTALQPANAAFLAAAWDPTQCVWLVGVQVGGPWVAQVYWSYGLDAGAQWTQVGASNVATSDTRGVDAMALAFDAHGAQLCWCILHKKNSGTLIVATATDFGATSWTAKRTLTGSTVGNVAAIACPGFVTPAQIYATGGLAAGNVVITTTTDGGTTWHDYSPYLSLPAAQNAQWALATNASVVVAAPVFWTPASPAVFTSPDGITWTSRSVSAIVGTGQIVGLTYSANLGLFVMLAIPNGGYCGTYTSPDGVTWTAVSTTAPALTDVADVAAMGNVLLATLVEGTDLGGSNVISSVDGGSTWALTQATLSANVDQSAYGYTRPRVVAGVNGVLVFSGAEARFSNISGEPVAGFPPPIELHP